MQVQIPVVENDIRLGLGRAQRKCVRLDPAERYLSGFADDFTKFTGELEIAFARHRLELSAVSMRIDNPRPK